jgi:hypothetical protein
MYNIWKHVAKDMENYGKQMENDETHRRENIQLQLDTNGI